MRLKPFVVPAAVFAAGIAAGVAVMLGSVYLASRPSRKAVK